MSIGLRIASSLMLALLLSVQSVSAKEVTLNFKNADIRAFIEFVSGFSGKNFLVDNRVKGNVTIVSPTPISEEEAYDVFLSVLEVNGFAAVESGSVTKILPRAEGKQEAIPVIGSGKKSKPNDAMITQVIRLTYADAQQLVALIRPLISPNSHLVAYPRGNMLLLTDTASNIGRIKRILKLVDRQDSIGVQLFPLEYASADKLASTITSLYTAQSKGTSGSIKAIAHQPGNILVVVADPQLLAEVSGMIKQLDVQPKPDSGRLKVRYLKHANAEDVAKVLTSLVGGQTGPGKGKALFAGDVKVVAEPATNALLITADPADITSINQIIDKLDVRRLQVLVEALIVEVKGDNAEQLGIEWMSGKEFNNGNLSVVGGQNFGTISSLGQAVAGNTTNANLATTAVSALGNGLTVGVLQGSLAGGAVTLGGLVRALESTGEANVLSTPNIMTMDNEEAEIVVGENVPFVTGQNSTAGGTANPFQTIERKDIGLTLKVKPQISEGDTVRLEIYQEVSSLSTRSVQGASDLVTNKRSVKTVALAKDGQMLVLGGLMREDVSESVTRVPCIGFIPIIGEPFKYTNNIRSKTNLMVFLRPRIIRTDADIRDVTNEKYSKIKGLYEKTFDEGTIIFPGVKKQLPESMVPEPLEKKSVPQEETKPQAESQTSG